MCYIRSNQLRAYWSMDKPNSLWSIKGVSPEARDAATKSAWTSHQPLGRWLSHVIHKTSTDEIGEPITHSEGNTRTGALPPAPLPSDTTWQEAVVQFEARITEIERQITADILPVENAIDRIADRLDTLETYVLRLPRRSYLGRLLRR